MNEAFRETLSVLKSIVSEPWKRSKREAGLIRWREVMIRMAADVLFVNFSMLFAALIWAAFHRDHNSSVAELITGGRHSVLAYMALWSIIGIALFHLHGFYTRTRGYAGRYKLLVIFRAVTLVVIAILLADYMFLGRGFSRAVAALGWGFMIISVVGARFAKDLVLDMYRIEPRARSPKRVQRVLVLGGAGYVGTALVPQLLARGYKVRVLDSFMFGSAGIQPFMTNPNFEVMTGDVREIEAVVEVMRDCDAVIDLAAIVGDPACEQDRQLTVEVNRAATRMLIDIARGYGVTRFLFASSCSVYGASEFLMDEHSTVAPISTYAQTKVDSEKLLLDAASRDFHPTVLRLGTLFGMSGRPRLDLVVNLLTARAATSGKITVYNGTQWRPFLHVADAARAFVTCLSADPALVSGEIFNVGDYEFNYRLNDISEKVKKLVPFTEIEHVENGDRRNYRVSFDKIHSRLGFRCERTVDEGMAEVYEWVKNNNVTDLAAAQFNNLTMMRAFIQTDQAQKSPLRVLATLSKCA
ncbi:MAG: NAD-dependent epimerase/dehydratase family protein [Terriglobales bacterium]